MTVTGLEKVNVIYVNDKIPEFLSSFSFFLSFFIYPATDIKVGTHTV